MSIGLHWYLPTHGDGHTLLQSGSALHALHHGKAPTESTSAVFDHERAGQRSRPPTHQYLTEVALAAERAGFDAVLTPTGTWCEDAWVATASLIPVTRRLRFLVAFRPGAVSPTLAAQQAATFQRMSGGRIMLNVVTGGEAAEQRRFGDRLDKEERYERTEEFLKIVRGAWSGEEFDLQGKHLWVEQALAPGVNEPPEIFFGGSSDSALRVAAHQADVYLSWGEPPPQLAAHLDRVRELAADAGRHLRFGVRMHVVTRATAERAWEGAEALIADADSETIESVHRSLGNADAVGQRRMAALHGGSRENLEVYPNLWAGVGLLRGGAGTALVGSHEQVADRIAEYHDLGIDEFILSGYPHVEEASRFGEGVVPLLEERGLLQERVGGSGHPAGAGAA